MIPRPALLLTAALTLAAGAFALQRATRPAPSPSSHAAPALAANALPALLPQGALLTIESPDFAALLHAWTASPQSAAWLQSANYSVFQNSRLFSRLSDAQTEFASTAKLDEAGTSFLQQIAGKQSIFAWYDVGNLQFLYITRLSPARAAQTALLQSRGRFSRRQAGTSTFYVRTEGQRTVAFATSGDLLLLATREDLIANALALIAHTSAPASSLAQEPWYAEAVEASAPAPNTPPDLHMVLNLDRLVPLPAFRTYWVQRNVTEMKQYRSAVADLYRDSTPAGPRFREERTLLLKSPPQPVPDPDLAPLAALVPAGTGVFRALATPDPALAAAVLNEKLLGHTTLPASSTSAPNPSLDASPQGSSSDLETRIDTPAPVSPSASTAALIQALSTSGLNAVLTLDSASQPDQSALWLTLPTAVVLRTDRPLDPATLASALQQALRGSLTASTLGIELRPTPQDPHILALTGPKPLFLALSGNLCLLANDQPLLAALLARVPSAAQAKPIPATLLAGFDHTSQRAPFLRLTSLIDATGSASATADSPTAPAFFSGNIASLSSTFSALQSQHILTRHQGEAIHQTVTYQWKP